jgi:protein-tyrosine kinase
MSRIHEALKKAEMERAPVQPLQVSPVPIHSQTQTKVTADERRSSLEGPSNFQTQTSVVTEEPANQIRIDNLLKECAHPEWHPDANSTVFSEPEKDPDGAEQFRTLRSRLYQIRGNQPLQTLLITSAVPGEGKTFVTCNLAQAISRQEGRRTLIIDADLRCPRLHAVLGAPNKPGLTDYLLGGADEGVVIQHGKAGNLWMIPSGTDVTNPSELLSNGRLKILLDRMTQIFDWIIIDSPPCLPVADAALMTDFCNGVLLVVRAGSTPSDLVRKAGSEIRKGKIVGVVLNAVEHDAGGYGSYTPRRYGSDATKLNRNSTPAR